MQIQVQAALIQSVNVSHFNFGNGKKWLEENSFLQVSFQESKLLVFAKVASFMS